MFENTSFGVQLDLLQRSMDVSLLRQNVIANNIANASTPNYKRTTVAFESRLGDALSRASRRDTFREALTDERHIAFDNPPDWRDVRPRMVLDYLTTAKNNGNNVDIEVESMNLLNNQLSYEAMTRSVADSFNRLNIVLQ